LRKLWRDLVRDQLTFWDGDDEDSGDIEESKQLNLKMMCAALARFTRNLVAGVPVNQQRAL
jgi:ataxin-10